MDPAQSKQLLSRARAGEADALGELLENFRPYLELIARRRLDSCVLARVTPSDVVQQTCLEAHRDLEAFRGEEAEELIAWLRQILEHNVAQSIQTHVVAQKRTVYKERRIAPTESGKVSLADRMESAQSSPSARAMRGEDAVRLARAMHALSDDQREAIRLRFLEGLSLAEIAARFGRSETAVAGLVKRGLQGLRKQFG